jgi:hypothetical protein
MFHLCKLSLFKMGITNSIFLNKYRAAAILLFKQFVSNKICLYLYSPPLPVLFQLDMVFINDKFCIYIAKFHLLVHYSKLLIQVLF